VTFFFKEFHALDIGTLLDLKNIAVRTGHLCAQPTLQKFGVSSVIRISFALYNTLEEIDALEKALQEVLETLR
jgi:cysteine desulfurase/selenocysteine lyase